MVRNLWEGIWATCHSNSEFVNGDRVESSWFQLPNLQGNSPNLLSVERSCLATSVQVNGCGVEKLRKIPNFWILVFNERLY